MSGGGCIYVPVAGTGAATAAWAEQAGLAFAQSMGITGTGAEALAALRALPVEKVNGDLSMEALLTKSDTYAGGPILDGKIVTGMPSEALRKRAAAKVPVLIGTTSDDLPVLFPPRDNPLSFFGTEAPAAQAVYFAGATDPVDAIKKIAVDMTMHEPARFVARQMTAAGQPAWLYRFGYVAESLRPKASGAEHSTECRTLRDAECSLRRGRDGQRPRDGRYFHGLHCRVRQDRRSEPQRPRVMAALRRCKIRADDVHT